MGPVQLGVDRKSAQKRIRIALESTQNYPESPQNHPDSLAPNLKLTQNRRRDPSYYQGLVSSHPALFSPVSCVWPLANNLVGESPGGYPE